VAASFARTGLPEPAVVGVRFAFERGEGDGAVPVRMALVGGTIAIAALVGAATFALSANRLLDTPRLYGWNWQVRAGSPALPDIGNLVAPALAGDPDVRSVASGTDSQVQVGATRVDVLALR